MWKKSLSTLVSSDNATFYHTTYHITFLPCYCEYHHIRHIFCIICVICVFSAESVQHRCNADLIKHSSWEYRSSMPHLHVNHNSRLHNSHVRPTWNSKQGHSSLGKLIAFSDLLRWNKCSRNACCKTILRNIAFIGSLQDILHSLNLVFRALLPSSVTSVYLIFLYGILSNNAFISMMRTGEKQNITHKSSNQLFTCPSCWWAKKIAADFFKQFQRFHWKLMILSKK